jgi:hypothetical protein
MAVQTFDPDSGGSAAHPAIGVWAPNIDRSERGRGDTGQGKGWIAALLRRRIAKGVELAAVGSIAIIAHLTHTIVVAVEIAARGGEWTEVLDIADSVRVVVVGDEVPMTVDGFHDPVIHVFIDLRCRCS